MNDFITTTQVAELIGVGPTTLRDWCNEGEGPQGIKTPGGHWRFKRADVDSWIKGLKQPPEPCATRTA